MRDGMRSYARYWGELFQLSRWSNEQVVSSLRLENEHLLTEALAAGRGIILVLPHSGNWDHAGAYVAARFGSITTVAEPLEPAELFEQFVRFRAARGVEVLGLGDPSLVRTLARRLADGRFVGLLCDRDLSGSGVEVDFFGRRASFPPGPAYLARLTGATVIPLFLRFDASGQTAVGLGSFTVPKTSDRVADVLAGTQAIASAFERGIARWPQDWHMTQPVWV